MEWKVRARLVTEGVAGQVWLGAARLVSARQAGKVVEIYEGGQVSAVVIDREGLL